MTLSMISICLSLPRLRQARLLMLLLAVLLSPLTTANDEEREIIRVGIYPFAPFVEQDTEGGYKGMTLELLELMNQHQDEFFFQTVAVSPKRRYQGYEQNDFDAIFYENKAWGWQDTDILSSIVYQTGGERYITLNRLGRDQSYFDNFSGKRMLGILGYHYGFADFNADEKYLQKEFSMTLTWSNTQNLRLLTASHGDVAVITEAYLRRYLRNNPHMRDQLLISDRYDQTYAHSVLIRPGLPLTLVKLNQLLETVRSSNDFITLCRRYGIEPLRKP